ncbi:MAG: NAD(P)H-dependent oxidoreductase subunit E [Pseudomonadota bacterium]
MNKHVPVITQNGKPVEPSRIHPGSGRRKAPKFNKGRKLDQDALAEARELLGDRSRQRDLLIEHLHLIQDRFGCLAARHLHALADEMRLPMAEVYEVASFYAHFDIVREGEDAPAPVTIRICDSLSCMLAGAEALEAELKTATDPADVRIVKAPCMGRCQNAPVAEVGHNHADHASVDKIVGMIDGKDFHPEIPGYVPLDEYRTHGGYALLERVTTGDLSADDMIEALSGAGLRGLGGAGFPTGTKWKIVRGFDGPRLMTVNGDEGEPGTFKDRHHLENDPHRFLEGTLIAARAVEAERVYIYMRDEYPVVLHILAAEIAALETAGLAAPGFLEVRRGAGAYICGEESAMLESIEGKRGLPRHRPPYIAEVGLFGRPTLNHNVETLFWLRDILERGADWFADQGVNGSKGFRSWSVSGRVANPGVIVAPAGITVAELIERAGGMAEGHTFKGYLPGGASGGILPASKADIPLDFGGKLAEEGCFVGSHAVVIMSQQDSIRAAVLNTMRFFKHESCGQCTPCRSGTDKIVRMMEAREANPKLYDDLLMVMRDSSICGLGQAAGNCVKHLMKHFPEEFDPNHSTSTEVAP